MIAAVIFSIVLVICFIGLGVSKVSKGNNKPTKSNNAAAPIQKQETTSNKAIKDTYKLIEELEDMKEIYYTTTDERILFEIDSLISVNFYFNLNFLALDY